MMYRPYLPASRKKYIATAICLMFILGALLAPPGPAAASTVLDDGIKYNKMVKTLSDGKTAEVNYLLIDTQKPKVEFKPVLAGNSLGNLDTLSSLSQEYGAVASVNGSFFSMSVNYIPIDTTIIDNQLLLKSGREGTSLICTQDKRVVIQDINPRVLLMLTDKKMVFNVDTFNIKCEEGITIYTSQYGSNTKTDLGAVEFVAKPGPGGYFISEMFNGGAPIPEGGFVISMMGFEKPYRYEFALGDRVAWSLDDRGCDGIKSLLTNGPLLVKNGCKTVPLNYEGIDKSLGGRNPRTAVGVTKNGLALLVTVDGRSEENAGMTFEELADLLIELGAYDAMALDGGGSTEMLIKGEIANQPSDGKERRLNNAILIISQIPVYLDNQRIYFQVPPVIQGGRLLVPVRKLFESLGAEVEWDGETRTVSAVSGDTRVELPIGKKTARINGINVSIDAEAVIVDGRTMVPLRFVSQALGTKVRWDADSQSVYINH